MTLVSEFVILAQKWSNKQIFTLGLHNSLLMEIGQDQQHDPAVHTYGVTGEKSVAVAVGVSDIDG